MNWHKLRKADIDTRRQLIRQFLVPISDPDKSTDAENGPASLFAFAGASRENLDLADVMVENAIGSIPVPLGLAGGFLIDGVERILPLATEEPSVVASASYAATVVARHGGFETWAGEPLMQGYVYLDETRAGSDKSVRAASGELGAFLSGVLAGMQTRGGGLREIDAEYIQLNDNSTCLRVKIVVDVRDAMGANIVNTCAETLRKPLEALTGGKALMAILSNSAENHKAGARFSIAVGDLARDDFTGAEAAERIARAFTLADSDPARCVTHNKGIMNGINALGLATANDTRGIEAAAHAWAARSGAYRSLSRFFVRDGYLHGELELPLPFATVGGATAFHPVAKLSLGIMGNPGAMMLCRYAAALGLAQNFAALWALTTEGIQKGHMRLHANRLAFAAGARGSEIKKLAEALAKSGEFNLTKANELFEALSESD